MNKSAKYFEKHCHGEMRVARYSVVRLAPRNYRASPASIGIAPAISYAKLFPALTTRHCTGLHTLSRLSRLCFKKSGQRKPNEYRLSRLSRLVPTIFNVYRNENEAARRVWGAGRGLISRHKTCMCNSTVQLEGTPWPFIMRVIQTALFSQDVIYKTRSTVEIGVANAVDLFKMGELCNKQ